MSRLFGAEGSSRERAEGSGHLNGMLCHPSRPTCYRMRTKIPTPVDPGRVCWRERQRERGAPPVARGAGPLALEQGGGGEGKVVTCGVTVDVIWFHDHVFILHDM